MNQPNLNPSEVRAEQAASQRLQTLKLGLDVHADSIGVVRILDQRAPQPAQKFSPAKFPVWIQTQVPLAEQGHSCYAAGPFGSGLPRALVALGVRNRVTQPVCLDEQHKGVNHDQSDAKQLALRRDRYGAGTPHALAPVRVPTPEEEQKRIESRQREPLKREVQRVAAPGRSLLLTQGQREKKGWGKEPRWTELRPKLPGWRGARLACFRRGLTLLPAELDAATTALEAAAPGVRPKGLGGLSSEVVDREIGDGHRFTNRRQVGSYPGLCGGVSASGRSPPLLPITKHGHVRLRPALVELAWRLVVWQRNSALVKKWGGSWATPRRRRPRGRKPSGRWRARWRWTCGAGAPAGRTPPSLAGRWWPPRPEAGRRERSQPDPLNAGEPRNFETARARTRTGVGNDPIGRSGALVSGR
jgi:transposase